MATTRESYYDQGHSTIRPPLFRGTNFSYWKILMQMFIKTEDYELWNIVTKGRHIPQTMIDGKSIMKIEDQYARKTLQDFQKIIRLCISYIAD